MLLDWGVAARARQGEGESGDRALVEAVVEGTIVAVVDGLGHGLEAAQAAEAAVEVVRRSAGASIVDIVLRCHEELMGTRGVVMSVARFDANPLRMTWLGVGNVEGRLYTRDASGPPPPQALVLRGGVVGSRLPGLRSTTLELMRGDTLVFATDGVEVGFDAAVHAGSTPRDIAERILSRHGRTTDDALVLVARLGA